MEKDRNFKKFSGETLFGINHSNTIYSIKKNTRPICYSTEWNDKEILIPAFEQHLKRRIATNVDWYKFFIQWKEQSSSVIEFKTHLKLIYPPEHEFTDRELRAWRTIMKSVGCTNITPFKNEEPMVNICKVIIFFIFLYCII
jgi:hypothetical protein